MSVFLSFLLRQIRDSDLSIVIPWLVAEELEGDAVDGPRAALVSALNPLVACVERCLLPESSLSYSSGL